MPAGSTKKYELLLIAVIAARAGLFCAVSPAIATLLGVTVLDEPFGVLDVLGLLLILASIALPYIKK